VLRRRYIKQVILLYSLSSIASKGFSNEDLFRPIICKVRPCKYHDGVDNNIIDFKEKKSRLSWLNLLFKKLDYLAGLLFSSAAFMVTIDAIDRSAGARLEGDLGLFSAFTAFNGEELAGSGWSKGGRFLLDRFLRSFGGASSAAGRAAFGRMVVALGLKGLLFLNCENVRGFAIEAD
jgi:hypothetical protein